MVEADVDDFSVGPVENPKRPDIDNLQDAVGFGPGDEPIFLASVGEKIVADISNLDGTWLVTRTGRVTSIDHPTGEFWCYDDDRGQSFGGNYRTTRKYKHTVYRLLQPKQKLRKKGHKQTVTPVTVGEAAQRRGRGRPKGSKNRPKEVIKQERVARAASKTRKKKTRARF